MMKAAAVLIVVVVLSGAVAECGPEATTSDSSTAAAPSAAQAATPSAAAAATAAQLSVSLVQAEPALSQPQQTTSDLLFAATLPKQSDDPDYVSAASVIVKHVAAAIQANPTGVPRELSTISFLFLRPDFDRLGNPGAHSFMTATFPIGDLKAARLDNLGAYGVLNLSSEVQVVGPWQTAIRNWCLMHNSAPDFCAQARGSLAPELQDAWDHPTGST